jgi:predicted  nucleic acid-binding Zn-ribbon protein
VTRASRLYELQVIDIALDRDRARLDEIQRRMHDDRALAAARETLRQAEGQSRQDGKTVREAEQAVADQQAKLREVEGKLYGGVVQNPKELQDLQRDAESLQRHLATLNDRLLEAMLAQEGSDQARQAAEVVVHQREAELADMHRDLEQEAIKLRADMDRRSTEREPVEAGIPPDDLALYARLRQSSGGVAVATVNDGACGVCGLVMSASGRQEVHSSPTPVRCRQCGRVLYDG